MTRPTKTILICDDDQGMRDTLTAILKRDYRVLTVSSGEVHVVMGPNGAGKTTLSSVVMGKPGYEVLAGSVTLDDIDVLALPAWQRAQARSISRPAIARDDRAGRMQPDRAAVVTEPDPRCQNVGLRGCSQRVRVRPALQPSREARNDARDLRLLEHDLRDEDRVRIHGPPPRQVAVLALVPGEERLLETAHAR